MMNVEWYDACLFEESEQQAAIDQIEAIKRLILDGESLRIWFEYTPDSLCAFKFLISELTDLQGEISYINLSELNTPIRKHDTRFTFEPSDLYEYLKTEHPLTPDEVDLISCEWKEICAQPYLVRAVINGQIVGVPEAFFDTLIESYIPVGFEFKPSRVEGECIVRTNAHFDSSFIEWRLCHILKGKSYEIVSGPSELPSNAYGSMLERMIFRRNH